MLLLTVLNENNGNFVKKLCFREYQARTTGEECSCNNWHSDWSTPFFHTLTLITFHFLCSCGFEENVIFVRYTKSPYLQKDTSCSCFSDSCKQFLSIRNSFALSCHLAMQNPVTHSVLSWFPASSNWRRMRWSVDPCPRSIWGRWPLSSICKFHIDIDLHLSHLSRDIDLQIQTQTLLHFVFCERMPPPPHTHTLALTKSNQDSWSTCDKHMELRLHRKPQYN